MKGMTQKITACL